ncbi:MULTISPECIES: bifunctional methylenetetrahydrofolate dehydrogenase/methenyltetrahydrofolate cyclohydrolase FolD [unclassified Sphingobium]|uniref:bifunctional methylenetetrahydrofolate dehydrogenase/methenyltetrahydrofolate cyclohydrolase FolD n=1 Tax=unclassified Sphingobium TaxID=2611147 RepID=UPI002224F7CF|nr:MULTISPECIES: bifunctional methylenetetrahydrofolate dehydrogenase/methenyltetrahydrofolate cyclohydrolase FolD [unclassified Sphingobium]MCW2365244.1 methylenetetrahydrofolate dehydrogenase (NADP+)/methenyltetrahydrofolate cyclohydrolase [Sphingobium sp. B7D2B]MCW2370678.1 methylenetetrahydrofolate dehydrogenase (NADP+)/methenyltetrahydrofolate cyclohydrolase [Sphingobium sp. B11D3D]MCW2380739.1 methylenetetrahydrofolate dehydrogenase (NADP+)/methenyltetrahydrofolate cyclohydrolase [Sphingob
MSLGKEIDGKAFAAKLRGRMAEAVPGFVEKTGRKPGLAVVLVGEDPASSVYVRSKGKATVEIGMNSLEFKRPATISQEELIELVEELNADDSVDGILVQLPLPAHLDDKAVIATIDPAKDVDGFHVVNAGKLAVGDPTALVPCTPLGCLMLLKDELGDLSGKEAVVIGRSNIVGKPMMQLLLAESCTVTVAHSRTHDLAGVVHRADIVVAAVGRPEMVKGSWIKPGAVVIDVGINRVKGDEDGKSKIVGDVATAEAINHVAAITPVPGGVGPMTIAVLLRNTLVAAHVRAGLPAPKGL